jgi:YegS/Rv2252/BmrU family lipid kinase
MKPKQTPDVFRFIINPKAGRRNRANLAGEIEAVFASAPERADCQIILTEQPNHATQLAAGFASQFGERVLVFACGGDGTAREVAAGIAGTPATMSILPIGTANDFAKTMFSTTQLSRLMQLLPDPTIRCIDTIAIDDEICLNITSLGFDTKVQLKAVQLNQRVRILGNLAYPVAILLSLFGNRTYGIDYDVQAIRADGTTEPFRGSAEIILSAICNGRYYGGGFNPAPKAEVDDGRLAFCLVDSLPLRRIIPLLPKYKSGQHLGDPAIHMTDIVSGTIRSNNGLLLGNIDGEPFEREQITFRVMPRSLNFACY